MPQKCGALAACGYEKVAVRKKPEVVIISTGDELVDVVCDFLIAWMSDHKKMYGIQLLILRYCDVNQRSYNTLRFRSAWVKGSFSFTRFNLSERI